jgi:tetratricopeptide (TPR) repeat protein
LAPSERDQSSLLALRSLDPGAVSALRLDRSREAYRNHDLVTAMLEAEELLGEEPDNTEALEVLGDTELELGHGREAALVFEHLLDLQPEEPLYLTGLAIARFLHTDFEGALAAGLEALAKVPDLTEAHAYVGLALERMGRQEEADQHLAQAATLDPEGWAPPPALHEIPWQPLLDAAMALVPETLHGFYAKVPIVWQNLPDPGVLRAVDPPISPLVLALYEGTPTAPGSETGLLPRSVRIFQGNARRFARDMRRLTEDLGHALAAEAADWLGVPMPDPPELETEPS